MRLETWEISQGKTWVEGFLVLFCFKWADCSHDFGKGACGEERILVEQISDEKAGGSTTCRVGREINCWQDEQPLLL